MKVIDTFKDEYFFLSNFYKCDVHYDGIKYKNSEAAFQAAKTLNLTMRKKISNYNPSEAKKEGRRLLLRPDWEESKDRIMEEIVRAKFKQNPELKSKLLATGSATLIEGNTWKDIYWGTCQGKGENKLGKILMKIREELQSD